MDIPISLDFSIAPHNVTRSFLLDTQALQHPIYKTTTLEDRAEGFILKDPTLEQF